jgi:signal transduction histidine kinase
MDAGVVRGLAVSSRPVDWLLVASLLLLLWFEIWVEPIFQTGMPGPRGPLTLLAVFAVLPLLARRDRPLTALMIMCAGILGIGVVGAPDQSAFVLILGLLVGVYALGAHATPRNALVGAGVVVLVSILFELLTFHDKTAADVAVPMLLTAGTWFVGREVHRQRERAAESEAHAALVARSHGLEVQAAITAERTRIARELHDVVAHAVSVMGVQAGAVRRTLAPGQDAQHEVLLDVERLGREALGEMRQMLGVLRTGDDDAGIGPLPDLTQLTDLAADARAAGLEVSLTVDEHLAGLAPGLQLTVYRVVQEAVTNVIKHAGAGRVDITIGRLGARLLELSVTDDGIGTSAAAQPGNGLIGMGERVAIHGGTLDVGPGEGRGFVVRAELPIDVAP